MKELEIAKEKLTQYDEDLNSLMKELEELYGEDYLDGDIIAEWDEERDKRYYVELCMLQNRLVQILENIETDNKKEKHRLNKALEELVTDARRIKHDRKDDIEKAQKMVDEIDNLISVCDKFRK